MSSETAFFTKKIHITLPGKLNNSPAWHYFTLLKEALSKKVILAVSLSLCASFIQGVGLILLLPLLQLVGLNAQQQPSAGITTYVSSFFVMVGLPITLVSVLCLYIIISITYALFSRWQTITSFAISYEFESFLRHRLYRAVISTNWLFFTRYRASNFIHALTGEITRVGVGTQQVLQLLVGVLVIFVYLFVALQLSAIATGMVFVFGLALLFGLKGKISLARTKGKALSDNTRDLYGAIAEHLYGMKTVKSYGAQEQNATIFLRLNARIKLIWGDFFRNVADTQCLIDSGSVVIISVALIVLIEGLHLPIASVLVLLFIFYQVIPQFSSIQQNYQGFTNMLPSFSNIMDLHARCDEEAERYVDDQSEIELRRSVEFQDVSFTYTDDGAPVFDNLDLTIRAGETTAIVGSSGVGKSTVADLIMGLIMPRHGQILIDGLPLSSERFDAWRSRIGYVAQDTFLFNDTVRANLLWAHPRATDEELTTALRMAAAKDFVSKLPEGIETILGDRGVRLSGGERQRLALARALLRKPTLLLLDEATSNLDSENEQRVQDAIDALRGRGDMTIVVIAHRLSTIRKADVIYVLDNGRIVECGDWEQLMLKEDGHFRDLWKRQVAS
jgi:ATP-binding cassette subfamily C protein